MSSKTSTLGAIDPAALPSSHAIAQLSALLRTVPDFPKPGIQFKDITPLLGDARGLQIALDLMVQPFIATGIEQVVAIEARGFIFGAPMAVRLGCGFVPIRKPGKLPADVDQVSYALEYGEGQLQMHRRSIAAGQRVLVVDDLLATGGTALAAADLVRTQGGEVAGFVFAVELGFLGARAEIVKRHGADVPVHALVHVAGE